MTYQALAQEYNPQVINKLDQKQRDSDYLLAVCLDQEEHLTRRMDDELFAQALTEIGKPNSYSTLRFFNSGNDEEQTQDLTEEYVSGLS
ncbi:hypothetical protein [Legionella qingyii]|uniref:Uncharacterized protein n=1 Tax=Legionella qingyii TaxID=2184757 RepID=A0ABY0CDU5_9GAMM|nr:hypothetical protein [Legionella qingyii]RUR19584.1 hypothetical protein ELY20_15735 [Legionella qingyii]RUR21941.1 hypothetical protein ELY16_15485 [Legionella qingyii]